MLTALPCRQLMDTTQLLLFKTRTQADNDSSSRMHSKLLQQQAAQAHTSE